MGFISSMLVTNVEIVKMKKLFLDLDANNDGFISVQEMENGLGKVVGALQATSTDISELLSMMDANGDGKIDY